MYIYIIYYIYKHRVSHPDEEDPGAICALLGAMKLNVWGGEESYSVSLVFSAIGVVVLLNHLHYRDGT